MVANSGRDPPVGIAATWKSKFQRLREVGLAKLRAGAFAVGYGPHTAVRRLGIWGLPGSGRSRPRANGDRAAGWKRGRGMMSPAVAPWGSRAEAGCGTVEPAAPRGAQTPDRWRAAGRQQHSACTWNTAGSRATRNKGATRPRTRGEMRQRDRDLRTANAQLDRTIASRRLFSRTRRRSANVWIWPAARDCAAAQRTRYQRQQTWAARVRGRAG